MPRRLSVFLLLLALAAQPVRAEIHNVIVMIADGWGHTQLDALACWYGERAVYEGDGWLSLALATSMINEGPEQPPYGDGQYAGSHGYDPDLAWGDWQYMQDFATDSGAAATAMSAGEKTYCGSIGMGVGDGTPYGRETLLLLNECAEQYGLATGVVTSVIWSHATPAAFAVHNISRNSFRQIASDMVAGNLEVIMGAGHPYFDDIGQARWPAPDDYGIWNYVGGYDLWMEIEAGTAGDEDYPWTLIDTQSGFENLALGRIVPSRVLGVAPVARTLQFCRPGLPPYNDPEPPYETPFLQNMPSLATMTRGALNVLGRDPDGFFLMVEGGAVDWAAHARALGRVIEELDEFNTAVETVLKWVDARDGWGETLVIVTGDHETGFLWGPGVLPCLPETWFPALVDHGPGQMPEFRFYSEPAGPENNAGHTNSLIPFFVRGYGSELFAVAADEEDPRHGAFLHNDEMGQVIFELFGELSTLPEDPVYPSGRYLLANYPNPFNPSTNIPYRVPVEGRLLLEIYDGFGRKVATLLDEKAVPGQYEQPFEAEGLSSGVYLCRITGEGFRDSRKIVLLQ